MYYFVELQICGRPLVLLTLNTLTVYIRGLLQYVLFYMLGLRQTVKGIWL